MKHIVLLLFSLSILSACKKSDDPSPSQNTTNPNSNPHAFASNLSYTATEATPFQIDLSDKVTVANGITWSITNANSLHGSVSITGKVINYTANADYSGKDTITITITDNKGNSTTGKITLTINPSTPTNHSPVISQANILFDKVQWLGNKYGYLIYIQYQPSAQTFNATDEDNDAVYITEVSGYSSNIQEIIGIATTEDVANGSFSGDIQIIPKSKIYAGRETLNITFSDGKTTVTKTITVQLGEDATIETYNIISPFFGQTLQGSAAGNFVIKSDGTINSETNLSFYGDACTPTASMPATYKLIGYFIEITSACGTKNSYQVAAITNGSQGFSMDSYFVIK